MEWNRRSTRHISDASQEEKEICIFYSGDQKKEKEEKEKVRSSEPSGNRAVLALAHPHDMRIHSLVAGTIWLMYGKQIHAALRSKAPSRWVLIYIMHE